MLRWIYDAKSPAGSRSKFHTIQMKLPAPVGRVSVNVRANGGSDAFVFSEVFCHLCYNFDLPIAPRTILDAGANAGFATIFFASKYGEADLACVEPMPENLEILRRNIESNRISAHVIAKALSTVDGPVKMQRASKDYGHKIADISFGRSLDGETVEVPGITVDSLMREMEWSSIDLLKLDIEGYEGILLRENCGWLEKVRAVCIECHEGFGEPELRTIATKFGFQMPRAIAGIWLMTRDERL